MIQRDADNRPAGVNADASAALNAWFDARGQATGSAGQAVGGALRAVTDAHHHRPRNWPAVLADRYRDRIWFIWFVTVMSVIHMTHTRGGQPRAAAPNAP